MRAIWQGIISFGMVSPSVNYEKTKQLARSVATSLEREFPDLILSRMQKSLRGGKVFVDWSQNDAHKTTVCVYPLRTKNRTAVSTPVAWEEVALTVKKKEARNLEFEADAILQRVTDLGDLFAPVLTLKQKLPAGL